MLDSRYIYIIITMAERYRGANMNLFLYLIVIICGLVVFTYAADGDVRIQGGAANSGRVEVEYNNIYGAVCIDGFDIENAHVVCKQLGFRDGALKVGAVDDFSFASGASLDIVLFSASCVGDETNIAKCPDVTWSGGTCPSNIQAAVFCALPYYEGCYESATPVGTANNYQTLHDFVNLCRVFQNAYAGSSQVSGSTNRCGNSLSEFGTLVDDSFCAEVCGNDPFQLCGGTGDYRAVYSTRLGSSEGFPLTGTSGSLTSFNYPGVYVPNDRQEWTVTLDSMEQVQITFPAFDINPGDVITISAGGMNETFTSRRTWISDPISYFTVWFESLSSGNGFILNYDVFIPSAATTVVPAQSTAQDTTTTQPPTTSDVVVTTPPSLDTTTPGSTATDPVAQGGTPSQPPPQPAVTTVQPPPQTVVTTMGQATTADEMATLDRQCLYPGLSNGAIVPAGTSAFVNDPITIACDAGFAAAFDTAVCEADGTFTNPIQCNIVKVETRLSLVPILLISALVSLFAVAIFVVIVWLVCRRKRLKHGSSQGIDVSERAVESPRMRDNPTFESSTAHDLRMTDVADCHGGNDPYMALKTPHVGPTFQVYKPLREVNSQGDGYEVPINGTNGQTGSEFQERPETDYEITHEYQDFTNSVVGRNNSNNESSIYGLQVHPETNYETTHEYQDPGAVGANIPQYESHINGFQEISKTDYEAIHDYEDPL